jgi:sterol desaturase/sphingolipid hydroxylase (fatty acid hydroxylase superfamily)
VVTLVVVCGVLLFVALWEFCRPRRRREFHATRRRLGNVGFWVLNLFIGAFFAPPDAAVRATLAADPGIAFPIWPMAHAGLALLAGFVLLDLLYYFVHRLEHAVPLLWRVHAMHHSDPDVDLTTALRHHPFEIFLTSAAYWFAALVLGISALIVGIHALAVFSTAVVQHGNLRLPDWLDRRLQLVLVTMDMHRIHHSVLADQANSNYGAIFSVWDRLFGTYRRIAQAQHENIAFGVRELPRRDCLKPSAMLLTPWLISRVGATEGPSEQPPSRG